VGSTASEVAIKWLGLLLGWVNVCGEVNHFRI